ncbi:MAG: acyl-CoA thioesterase [Acidimicrobiales bacterium]
MYPSFKVMMDLASHGPDTYVGAGPHYPWHGLYGGQIVAQALRAAELTVKPSYLPHSLHAYFIRMGDPDEPVRFEVERLRDGRSFVARQVVARQSTGAILNMSASFQVESAPTMDVQLAERPQVAGPEEGKELSWSGLFEIRSVEGSYQDLAEGRPAACSWFRVLEALDDRPATHAAALAYASDSGPGWLVSSLHEAKCAPGPAWRPVSLDHALWFHRPFRADDWLLFQASASSLYNSRGLCRGRMFAQDGALVASVAQEVLLRRPHRPDA